MRDAPSTVRDRVTMFLREHAGEAWCAECVAAYVEADMARVRNLFMPLEGHPSYRRVDTACAGCRRKRLTMRFDRRRVPR